MIDKMNNYLGAAFVVGYLLSADMLEVSQDLQSFQPPQAYEGPATAGPSPSQECIAEAERQAELGRPGPEQGERDHAPEQKEKLPDLGGAIEEHFKRKDAIEEAEQIDSANRAQAKDAADAKLQAGLADVAEKRQAEYGRIEKFADDAKDRTADEAVHSMIDGIRDERLAVAKQDFDGQEATHKASHQAELAAIEPQAPLTPTVSVPAISEPARDDR